MTHSWFEIYSLAIGMCPFRLALQIENSTDLIISSKRNKGGRGRKSKSHSQIMMAEFRFWDPLLHDAVSCSCREIRRERNQTKTKTQNSEMDEIHHSTCF